ncbi:hypothetical protein OA956_05125, partial [Bacteroidota bacterium]|nr:hypothetical protein [Bacteroidota bacterium]
NTTIVDKRSKDNNSNVDILIIDGIITEIKKNLNLDKHNSKIKVIDIKNCHVSPGWFDFHVNFCDPGFENRDTIETGINSSVKGGFTGVQIMPNTEPNIDNKSIIEYINNKSSGSIVDIFASANITKKANGEDLVEMYDILKSGCKSFTDDKKSISNSKVLNLSLEYAKDLNTLIIHHPSDKELINHGVVNEGALSTKLGLKGIPNISEFLTTYRDIEINNYSNGKIHLSYISTSESVKLIRKQKKSENNITCDVSIYNTFLDESNVDNFDTRYKLEGLYAQVQTNNNVPEFTQALNTSGNVSFDNSNSTIQERTAYRAVNVIHTHLKSVFPTFTALDIPLETNLDEAGTCNAYYSGNSINFYAEGLSANGTDYCENTGKISDVVYHEYGHAINGNRYNSGTGMFNGALNEGFADIWAFTITIDPILGIGFYQNNPNGYVRRFDINKKVYPQDLVGQVHADGEIIAGSFWDLYLLLGNMQQVINLFKETFDSGIDGPNGNEGSIYTDILVEVLYADDNDGNLANGTPNDLSIIQAFATHGITLISNANINHNAVTSANPNTGIGLQANIQLTYPWALGDVNCFYRLNKDTTWNVTNLTSSGNNYTANIPSQPAGTIIAYYLSMEDIYGIESGVTPMKSNFTPINYANVPYFILVGYELMEEEDFDFNLGFWLTSDPQDNATTGQWELGNPLGSYTDPNDPSTIVQTDDQHTQGGINCAFTGNASSSQSSIGENDIDGGHTTLYSPYYDMTDYNDPAFTYWRWYTNNTGAEPNADWWQVKISEDGINWIKIENNLTSDISWRRFAFRAKDYVDLTSTSVQLKFVASDSAYGALSSGSLVEAAVDDLYLWDSNSSVSVEDINHKLNAKLLKITDVLGREVIGSEINYHSVLLYIYSNGFVERVYNSPNRF